MILVFDFFKCLVFVDVIVMFVNKSFLSVLLWIFFFFCVLVFFLDEEEDDDDIEEFELLEK